MSFTFPDFKKDTVRTDKSQENCLRQCLLRSQFISKSGLYAPSAVAFPLSLNSY